MAVTDLRTALRILSANGTGTIELKDRTVVSGALSNIEDEANDPYGIGSFDIDTENGGEWIFFNEFAALLESPVGTPV